MAQKPAGSLRPVVALLLALTATYAVGFVASLAVNRGLPFWYVIVAKPKWALPGVLFVPILTVVYGLTGVALWQLRSAPPLCRVLVGIPLLAIALWSWTFFAWQRPLPAVILAIILWLTGLSAILASRRTEPTSVRLLVPGLAWATYLVALTIAVWRMNRG